MPKSKFVKLVQLVNFVQNTISVEEEIVRLDTIREMESFQVRV